MIASRPHETGSARGSFMKASVFLVAAALIAAPAAAQPSRIFVFGDSLVDAGNAQIARRLAGGPDPAPAALGYFDGRFSNGPTFADYASELYYGAGTYTAPALAGGTNFAVGGAQALEVAGDASPSFGEQIAPFTTPTGLRIDPDALVIVTFGGNDVRRELEIYARQLRQSNPPEPDDYDADFAPTRAAMESGLQALFDAGARNIVVTGLPDVGAIPNITFRDIPALQIEGLQMSTTLNGIFRNLVADFRQSTGANFSFFDFLAFQDRLSANPAVFGLPSTLNTTDACLGTQAAPTCADYVYFDPVHPTTNVHRAIALELVAVAGVPEPATWGMMIAGFGAVGVALRRRRVALAA